VGEEVLPIHALGFFHVCRNGLFYETITFDYLDLDEYYYNLEKDELEDEFNRLISNMQYFLDKEKIVINGENSKPLVHGIDICFRGSTQRPSTIFLITFQGKLKRGLNIYENYYEESIAPYDFESYWLFPPKSRVVSVDIDGEYDIFGDKNILVIWVKSGEKMRGYERIEFILK